MQENWGKVLEKVTVETFCTLHLSYKQFLDTTFVLLDLPQRIDV